MGVGGGGDLSSGRKHMKNTSMGPKRTKAGNRQSEARALQNPTVARVLSGNQVVGAKNHAFPKGLLGGGRIDFAIWACRFLGGPQMDFWFPFQANRKGVQNPQKTEPSVAQRPRRSEPGCWRPQWP